MPKLSQNDINKDNNMKLENKVALITGAGRGIGRAISILFANQGAKLAIFSRTTTEVKQTASMCGNNPLWETLDVRNKKGVEKFIKKTADKFGRIDILVNNAGIAKSAPLLNTTPDFWDETIETNLTSVYFCTKIVLPFMIKQRFGRVINIASISGKMGSQYISAYSASKFGVIGFTQSVAQEVTGSGICINAICPGYVKTQILDDAVKNIVIKTGQDQKVTRRKLALENLQKRFIEPEEVAKLALFLVSEDSGFLSGEAINIW